MFLVPIAALSFSLQVDTVRLEDLDLSPIRQDWNTAKKDLMIITTTQTARFEGLPRLGPHIFMGDRMQAYQANSGRGMREGRLSMVEALVRKP